MESSFYVIILLLIFLKLMIWLCVFYSRSRRRQLMQENNTGVPIIAQGTVMPHGHNIRDVDGIMRHEHYPGMYPTGLDNPAMSAAPPSYEEVQHTKSMEEKPPSYDQIASYYTMPPGGPGVGMPVSTGLPVSSIDMSNTTSRDVPSNNQTISAQLPAYSETDQNTTANGSSSQYPNLSQ